MTGRHRHVRRIPSWVRLAWKRYGPPEIVGLIAALLGLLFGLVNTGLLIAGIGAATLAETVAYLGTVALMAIFRAVRANPELRHHAFSRRCLLIGWHAIRDSVEFFVAEAVDTPVVRPGLTWAGSYGFTHFHLWGGLLAGFLLGKFAADAVYIVLLITVRHLSHNYRGRAPRQSPAGAAPVLEPAGWTLESALEQASNCVYVVSGYAYVRRHLSPDQVGETGL